MEQMRMLLAIVLSFLVFMAWNYFFTEPPPPTAPGGEQYQKQAQSESMPETAPETAAPRQASGEPSSREAAPVQPMPTSTRTITVETPLYSVTLSEKGAGIQNCVLSQYRETMDPESPSKEIISATLPSGTFLLNFSNAAHSISGATAVFQANTDSEHIRVTQLPTQLAFTHRTANGLVLTKTYTFSPDRYLIGLDISITNQTGQDIDGNLQLFLNQQWTEQNNSYGFTGPSAYVGGSLKTFEVDDLDEKNSLTGPIQWIAMQHRYFMTAVIPKNITDSGIHITLNPSKVIESRLEYPAGIIPNGGTTRYPFELYTGPKSVQILKSIGYELDEAVHFGFFDIIAKPCLLLMNFIYSFIPNYGVAIIILTVFVKILFWPLGTKSYKSMNEMKKLQPLMAELREKYKDDKKRMNEEVMGLYRTYKINPLGGCLPMVAQIPVFFALYQMLYGAIELRHAPFFGWINDLSAPDRLFDLGQYGIAIPFMEPPYGIPVLTIIMGATMLIQQKLQPPAGDPTQAKMMMFMPIIFTVIFINFSSGLVLYWLVNNILSIAQQYYVSKKNA